MNDEQKRTQWQAMSAPDAHFSSTTSAKRLRVTGPDALDFLHRMSTNDVVGRMSNATHASKLYLNCFVDKRGRLVDLVHQQNHSDQSSTLVAEKDAHVLAKFLSGFHFMEELEIQLVDESAQRVFGRGVLAALELHQEDAEGTSSVDDLVRGFDFFSADGAAVPTYFVFGELAQRAREFLVLDGDVEIAAQIASGAPAPPHEVCDAHNPLELGLHDALDWKKGCYIGQEVIARIDNYGKQMKRLVGVKLSSSDLDTETFNKRAIKLEEGMSVEIEGKVIGQLLSTSSPALRDPRVCAALAMVKAPPLDDDLAAKIGDVEVFLTRRDAEQQPHD